MSNSCAHVTAHEFSERCIFAAGSLRPSVRKSARFNRRGSADSSHCVGSSARLAFVAGQFDGIERAARAHLQPGGIPLDPAALPGASRQLHRCAVILEAVTNLLIHVARRDAVGRLLQQRCNVIENFIVGARFLLRGIGARELERPQRHDFAHHVAFSVHAQARAVVPRDDNTRRSTLAAGSAGTAVSSMVTLSSLAASQERYLKGARVSPRPTAASQLRAHSSDLRSRAAPATRSVVFAVA
jgi:hypothetical protein